jgi:hypothetical protein
MNKWPFPPPSPIDRDAYLESLRDEESKIRAILETGAANSFQHRLFLDRLDQIFISRAVAETWYEQN